MSDQTGGPQEPERPEGPPTDDGSRADTTWLTPAPTWVDPQVPPVAPSWSSPTAPPAYGAPPPPPPTYAAPAGAGSAPEPPPPPAYGGYPPPALPGVAGWGAVPVAPKPGVIPLRPLGVGEILDGAISYMRRDPKTVLGISAVIAAAIALLQMALYASLSTLFSQVLSDPAFSSGSRGSSSTDMSALTSGLAGLGGVALLVTAVTFLLNVLATGLLTTAMGRAVLGREVSTSDVWRRAAARFWPLLGLTLLVGLSVSAAGVGGVGVAVLLGWVLGQVNVGLGVLLGFAVGIAAVLATVWLSIMLLLAPVALVLEDIGVVASMRRSFALVRGAWWRTFGINLLATILGAVVAQVLTFPFTLISGIGSAMSASSSTLNDPFSFGQSLAGALGTLISQTVVIPFTAGIVALLYIDRRIRREALDIELARAAGVAEART